MAEVSEECKLALKAAMDLIGEKCAVTFPATKTFELYGAKVTVPPEVAKIASANPELTYEERLTALKANPWARGWAEGLMSRMMPTAWSEMTAEERETSIDRAIENVLAPKIIV